MTTFKLMTFEEWKKANPDLVAEHADEYEECSNCDGTGDCECKDCGMVHDCAICQGTGKVAVDDDKQTLETVYYEQLKRDQLAIERWQAVAA